MNASQTVHESLNKHNAVQTRCSKVCLILSPDDTGVSLQRGVNVPTAVPPRVQIHSLVTLQTKHTDTQVIFFLDLFVLVNSRTYRGSEQVGLCLVGIPLDRPHVPFTLPADFPRRLRRSLQVHHVEETASEDTRQDGGSSLSFSVPPADLKMWR